MLALPETEAAIVSGTAAFRGRSETVCVWIAGEERRTDAPRAGSEPGANAKWLSPF
jgi:hypothetical protein